VVIASSTRGFLDPGAGTPPRDQIVTSPSQAGWNWLTVRDGWQTLYAFKRHFDKYEFEKYGVNKDEYCAIGADAACLELIIQGPEFPMPLS
jgi:hypothetical protein